MLALKGRGFSRAETAAEWLWL